MKCIRISGFGGPEVLRLVEEPAPAPRDAEVLIQVHAAGVNRADLIQRKGKYPPPPGASEIPGLEVAGEVAEAGRAVESVRTGDHVCALIAGGGYAEYAVADSATCLPVPRGMSLQEAAAIPETFFTVWSNVFDRAGLKAGETLLVHGGSSGIGTTAIQLAKVFGASVFTTAGSEEKCEACRQLGADLAVNYRTRDFVAECAAATGGRGVDVILDMVAGDYLDRNIRACAEDGRIVIIAGLGGYQTRIDLLPIIRKRLVITGSGLRGRPVEFKAQIAKDLKQRVWPLLEAGKVKPILHRVMPLADAAGAHRLMESGVHIGKIVLKVL